MNTLEISMNNQEPSCFPMNEISNYIHTCCRQTAGKTVEEFEELVVEDLSEKYHRRGSNHENPHSKISGSNLEVTSSTISNGSQITTNDPYDSMFTNAASNEHESSDHYNCDCENSFCVSGDMNNASNAHKTSGGCRNTTSYDSSTILKYPCYEQHCTNNQENLGITYQMQQEGGSKSHHSPTYNYDFDENQSPAAETLHSQDCKKAQMKYFTNEVIKANDVQNFNSDEHVIFNLAGGTKFVTTSRSFREGSIEKSHHKFVNNNDINNGNICCHCPQEEHQQHFPKSKSNFNSYGTSHEYQAYPTENVCCYPYPHEPSLCQASSGEDDTSFNASENKIENELASTTRMPTHQPIYRYHYSQQNHHQNISPFYNDCPPCPYYHDCSYHYNYQDSHGETSSTSNPYGNCWNDPTGATTSNQQNKRSFYEYESASSYNALHNPSSAGIDHQSAVHTMTYLNRTRSTKKRSKKRPDNMPRYPLSAYNFFFREQREVILAMLTVFPREEARSQDDRDHDPSGRRVKIRSKDDHETSFSDVLESGDANDASVGTTVESGTKFQSQEEEMQHVKNILANCKMPSKEMEELQKKIKANTQKMLDTHLEGDKAKKSHKKTHGKITFQVLSKVVGERWRQICDDNIKEYYSNLAKKDMKRYEKQIVNYENPLR